MSNEHLCNGGPEDGKQCGCRLTQEKLEAKESRLNNDICTLCGHHLGHHPAGPQGEGRSSCHLIQHRCCDLKLSLAHLTPHLIHHLLKVLNSSSFPFFSITSALNSFLYNIYVSSHFSIALSALKSLYISHLI